MKTGTFLSKVIGAVLFICGGLVGGFSQVHGTFFSKKPILGLFISLIIMSIGVAFWKSKKSDEMN